jgi:hypothetical protein
MAAKNKYLAQISKPGTGESAKNGLNAIGLDAGCLLAALSRMVRLP